MRLVGLIERGTATSLGSDLLRPPSPPSQQQTDLNFRLFTASRPATTWGTSRTGNTTFALLPDRVFLVKTLPNNHKSFVLSMLIGVSLLRVDLTIWLAGMLLPRHRGIN